MALSYRCCYEWTLFYFYLSITIKGLSKKWPELGHRTKNKVTMWTQHHTALHHLAPPLHGSAPLWLINPHTHRPFTYKEIQTWVAIKTHVHTWLGLQPSVGLYSYPNVHTCVSSLIIPVRLSCCALNDKTQDASWFRHWQLCLLWKISTNPTGFQFSSFAEGIL